MEKTVAEVIELCKNLKPSYINEEDIAHDLGIDAYSLSTVDTAILYCKWFDTWTCWDTMVGKSVVYLKDEPVAITTQSARKSDTDCFWFSAEAAEKVRQYLRTLEQPTIDNKSYISLDTIVPIEGDIIGNSHSANYFLGKIK